MLTIKTSQREIITATKSQKDNKATRHGHIPSVITTSHQVIFTEIISDIASSTESIHHGKRNSRPNA